MRSDPLWCFLRQKNWWNSNSCPWYDSPSAYSRESDYLLPYLNVSYLASPHLTIPCHLTISPSYLTSHHIPFCYSLPRLTLHDPASPHLTSPRLTLPFLTSLSSTSLFRLSFSPFHTLVHWTCWSNYVTWTATPRHPPYRLLQVTVHFTVCVVSYMIIIRIKQSEALTSKDTHLLHIYHEVCALPTISSSSLVTRY